MRSIGELAGQEETIIWCLVIASQDVSSTNVLMLKHSLTTKQAQDIPPQTVWGTRRDIFRQIQPPQRSLRRYQKPRDAINTEDSNFDPCDGNTLDRFTTAQDIYSNTQTFTRAWINICIEWSTRLLSTPFTQRITKNPQARYSSWEYPDYQRTQGL